MNLELATMLGAGSVPFIVGIAQGFKLAQFPPRYVPILDLVLGILINVVVGKQLDVDPVLSVLFGVMAGLMAAGLWSGTKSALGR